MLKSPVRPDSVAVLGAGIAGLTAARELARAGVGVVVFDKGRGPGGRTSTRRDTNGPSFDHGAQYFTAAHPAFAQQVAAWTAAGVAAEWLGRVDAVECDVARGCRPLDSPPPRRRFVGTPGMNALAKGLAEEVRAAGGEVVVGVRVAPPERSGGLWRLTAESGGPLGEFAAVLVTAPAPQAAELLAASPALANAARSTPMTGCWAVMAAFAERVAVAADGLFVNGPPDATPLAWVCRDSSKPGRALPPDAPDAWVLHASGAWSEAHLDAPREAVSGQLLDAFWHATGQAPRPARQLDAHLWRYALPPNPLPEAVLIDSPLRLFAAGDWCGGPKVEGAYRSGLAAAAAILANL